MRHSIMFVLASLASVGCHPAIDQNLECTVEYLDGNVVGDTEAHLGDPVALVDFVYDEIDAENFDVAGRTYAGTLRVTTNRSSVFEWVLRFLYVNFGINADGDTFYGEPDVAGESNANFASDIQMECDFYDRDGMPLTLASFSPSATYGEGRAQFAHDEDADFPVPEDGEKIEGVAIPHTLEMHLGCTDPGTDKKVNAYLPKPSSATWGLVEYHNRSITPVVITNNGTVLNDTPPVLDPEPMN